MIFETLDKEAQDGIIMYINHIRKMNMIDDYSLQEILAKQCIEDPGVLEKFKVGKQKKEINTLLKSIKQQQQQPLSDKLNKLDNNLDSVFTTLPKSASKPNNFVRKVA